MRDKTSEVLTESYYVEGGFCHQIHMTAAHLWWIGLAVVGKEIKTRIAFSVSATENIWNNGGKHYGQIGTEDTWRGKWPWLCPCRGLLNPSYRTAGGRWPPHREMGADAPGVSGGNEPAYAQPPDFDGQTAHLPCRLGWAGAGSLSAHHQADGRRRGRDWGFEAPVTVWMD